MKYNRRPLRHFEVFERHNRLGRVTVPRSRSLGIPACSSCRLFTTLKGNKIVTECIKILNAISSPRKKEKRSWHLLGCFGRTYVLA